MNSDHTQMRFLLVRNRGACRIVVILFLLLLAATPSLQGQYFPGYVMNAIDTAMSSIVMTRSDLSMRWDAAGNDTSRLDLLRRLFADPLATFTVADSIATMGLNYSVEPGPFFSYVGRLLDIPDGSFRSIRVLPNDSDIRFATKISIDTLDFTSALILRKFLALAVATDAASVSARGQIEPDRLARIVDYCDSLLIQSEGGGDATLVEMKEAERYGLARNKKFFNQDAAGLDYARLLGPGVTQFTMALDVAKKMAPEAAKFAQSVKTQLFRTPLGLVALGGGGDDIYTGDFFCIIDLGGNDIYRPTPRDKAAAFDHSTTLIVDFSGNDTYIGQDYDFGGALFGASTLIDLEGNDSYSAQNFSLGCGFFGTSVLYDGAGSDRYNGGTAVQGAGIFGIGVLYDIQGNDNYLAHLTSQGFGYTRGFGAIVDVTGNDSYIASSPYTDFLRYSDHFETFCQGAALGARPVASAGIGIIVEGGGSDNYVSDIFGQGTGYWFGLGAIVDRKGNDNYNAYQYAQGSGVHLAFGVLIDSSGNDNYISHGVSQGCGHDIAFGGLYDAGGDDNYVVESLSLGGGNADAVSLFIDAGGEDGYLARRDNTLGYSDLRREYGMIGIFLDLERKDFYGTSRGGNDSVWTGSYYGVGLDRELRPKDSTPPNTDPDGTPKKSPEEIEKELANDIPTLFIQASAAPQKWQYIVEPARKRLVDSADSSLPYLLGQLNTESPREALALGIILPRIGKKAFTDLVDTVRYGEINRVSKAMYALGEMKDTMAASAIGERLVDTSISWRLRASAGEAILKLRSQASKPFLKQALRDSFELVRGYATRALVMVADSAELVTMRPMLDDPSQIVRYQFQLALQRRNIDSIPGAFVDLMLASPSGPPHLLLLALARGFTDTPGRSRLLDGMLKSKQPSVRADAVRLGIHWNDDASLRRLAALRGSETAPEVTEALKGLPTTAGGKHEPRESPRPKKEAAKSAKTTDKKASTPVKKSKTPTTANEKKKKPK